MSPDYTEFRKLEEEAWERVAGINDSVWSSLTTLFVQPLLLAGNVSKGMKVLDVACGPGHCAIVAKHAGAEVMGIDFSPGMIQTVLIPMSFFPGKIRISDTRTTTLRSRWRFN